MAKAKELDVFSVRDLRLRSGELLRDAEEGRLAVITRCSRKLQLEASRPGSFALSKAKEAGWLSSEDVPESADLAKLAEVLDRGEPEAIVLAQSKDARLLIDERKGGLVARSRGVTVIGTGEVCCS